ncbi:hypothetical protein CMV_016400 [Castanea mollissima]|uniref:Uncharacterized protein n=1 Tax=Castanea mollissima TaxID=60419 RepID=A0A8J4VRQ7_9ROSI|nr:hypothetical protein CMV_016400 [Castanea mollissima]
MRTRRWDCIEHCILLFNFIHGFLHWLCCPLSHPLPPSVGISSGAAAAAAAAIKVGKRPENDGKLVALNNPYRMVKIVFVFSNVGFQRGGDKILPEIVFWNARDFASSLLSRKREGVAMVCGVLNGSLTTLLEENVASSLENLVKSVPKPEKLESVSNFWGKLL